VENYMLFLPSSYGYGTTATIWNPHVLLQSAHADPKLCYDIDNALLRYASLFLHVRLLLIICLWLAHSRTEKPLDKESGAASFLENERRTVVTVTAYWTLNLYGDVIVHICELNLCWLWTSKLKLKLKLNWNKNYLKLKLKLELFTKPN